MAIIHVVIPCYNVEKYLEQVVYSVLDQPCKDIDIVLVDDGSPGATPSLCDTLAEKEARVHVIHKKNGGISDARNAGIDYVLTHLCSSGREFVCFLDGDDAWCPNVIDAQVLEHLLTDWDEDVIGFSGVLANNTLDRYSDKLSVLEMSGANARAVMWQSHQVHMSAKLFAVDVLRKWDIRFQYKLPYSEDKIFLNQFYYLADRARFVNKTLHIYRKNYAGAMSNLRKLSAMDYYLPIVDGWLKCDEFLNAVSDRTQTTACVGQALASVYLVEMVEAHLKKWGSLAEIMPVLRNHPHYPYVEDPQLVRSNLREYRKNRLLLEQPAVFAAKCYLNGALEWILWKLLRIPLVAQLREKRQYPHVDIPD